MDMPGPRFGIAINHRNSAAEVLRAAGMAEEAQFDEIWVSEDNGQRGAFALATAIAMATSRARVGVGVVNPWTRHPFQIAMEAATLHELSRGRLILGMGSGNSHAVSEELGIPYQQPLSRLLEATRLIREALAPGFGGFRGDFYQAGIPLAFSAGDLTQPPVVLGVKNERAIRLGAEVCDSFLLSLLATPEYLRWVNQVAARPIRASAYVLFACTPDADQARAAARPVVANFLGVHGASDITSCPGLSTELADEFKERKARNLDAADLVSDEILDMFAVAGDTEMCISGLARFVAGGFETVILRTLPQVPLDQTLHGFATARTALRSPAADNLSPSETHRGAPFA